MDYPIKPSEKIKQLRDEHIYIYPKEYDGPVGRTGMVHMIFPDYREEKKIPLHIDITDDNEDEIIEEVRNQYKKKLEEIRETPLCREV